MIVSLRKRQRTLPMTRGHRLRTVSLWPAESSSETTNDRRTPMHTNREHPRELPGSAMKQREGHRVIFGKMAEDRIAASCCPTCGKHKDEWTRTKSYRCCSAACTDKFWREIVQVRSWQHLRLQCFERDGYACRMCGVKPVPLRKKHVRTTEGYREPYYGWKIIDEEVTPEDPSYVSLLSSCFVADHIQPIALGGDEWDLNNLQSLCRQCNKAKTAKDAARIAAGRKSEKMESVGQRRLTA